MNGNIKKVVYILNRGPHDYTPAEQFGSLEFCTSGSIDRNDIAQMYRECSSAMRDSQPDDYIVLTSLASLCSVACSIFAMKHGQLNLLIFHDGAYIERTIYLDEMNNF